MAVDFYFAGFLCPVFGGAETPAVRACAGQSGYGNVAQTVPFPGGKNPARAANAVLCRSASIFFALAPDSRPDRNVANGTNAVSPGGFSRQEGH